MRILDRFTANKIRDGDVQAFEELINRHKDNIFSYCLRLIGDYHLSEEVAQEVFIKVYQKIDTYNHRKAALSTWIYTIAHNTCLNLLRDKPLDWQVIDEVSCTIVDCPSAESEFFKEEWKNQFLIALNTLSLEDKDLVLLKAYFGLKYEELSKLKGIPVGTVKSRIHQIRVKLKKVLGEKDD